MKILNKDRMISLRCHQINEALSESLWKDRMKREAYINWREEFDFVLQDNLRLTMVNTLYMGSLIRKAARTVADLAVKREKAVLKQKLSQWHKQAHFQRRIRVFMRHLLWRQYIKNVFGKNIFIFLNFFSDKDCF